MNNKTLYTYWPPLFFKLRSCIVLIIVSVSLNIAFAQDTARVSLLFLGDIMQHDSQIEAAYNTTTGRYDYTECFRLLKPYFQSVDLTIGNLELTLGGKPFKGYPQFSAPDELAIALKNVGVDVLVTANNHSVDRRKKGLEQTIRVLDSLGILHTGTFRDEVERLNDYPLMISKNGVRLALLNYTYGTNGIPVTPPNIVNLIDTAVMRKDLMRAKELGPDATIVFMHWGDEYQSQPNKIQKQLAAFCFKYGATLVIGAHPHVLQPMEWDKENNRLVAYSLGNFVSGQRPRYRDGGGMLQVELQKIYYDTISVTTIDTVNHMLQWVYRTNDTRRKFYVLPVPTVEREVASYIHDEVSKNSFKTFLDDSRQLLSRQNNGIVEQNVAPVDSVVRYKVLLEQAERPEGWQVFPPDGAFNHGLEIIYTETSMLMLTGNFRRRADAERYLERLLLQWPEGRVVKFVNKELVE